MNKPKIISSISFYRRWITRFIQCGYYNRFPNKSVPDLIDIHRKQKENWDILSEDASTQMSQSDYEKRSEFKLGLIDSEPGHCLEIGCESGWFGNMLLEKYPETKYTGIDFRIEAFKKSDNMNHNLLLANAVHLPFKNDSFDLFLAFHIIEHIRDIKAFAKDMHCIVKDNSIIILCVPLGFDTDPCHRWHFMTKNGWVGFIKRELDLKPIQHFVDNSVPGEYTGIYRKC